jgi:hypothetical protein
VGSSKIKRNAIIWTHPSCPQKVETRKIQVVAHLKVETRKIQVVLRQDERYRSL